MLISLWPAGWVAVGVANSSAASSGGGSNSSTSSPPSSAVRQPDYAGLNRLQARESQLANQLRTSEALRGVPDLGIAAAARRLFAGYQEWESQNAGLGTRVERIVSRQATMAQRIAAFASHPSRQSLTALNDAVTAYNAARHTG
jgi:hypothetical protein